MTPYNADFFQHSAAMSMDAVVSFTTVVGVTGDIDAAEGLISWLERLSDKDLADEDGLVKGYWSHHETLSSSSKHIDAARSIRLTSSGESSYSGTLIYTPTGAMLSAIVWPRDSTDVDLHDTKEKLLSARQMHYFERAAKLLHRVQNLLDEDTSSLSPRPFDEFVTHSLGHIRDKSALNWLIDFTGGIEAISNIPAGRWKPVFISSDKGKWEGMTSYMACQFNPFAIDALMDRDPAWGVRILSALEERVASNNYGNKRADKLWADIFTQEVHGNHAKDPKSLLSTFERMVRAAPVEVGVGHTLNMMSALLEARMDRDKGGTAQLPVIDRLLNGLPANTPAILAADFAQGAKRPQLKRFATEATEACHLPCVELLGEALTGPLKYADRFWPRRSKEYGLYGPLISGAISRDDIPIGDLAAVARFFQSCGMDCDQVTTENYGNILHAMAEAGKKSGKELLPKMMVFVELGVDPHDKNDRGWKPGSFLEGSNRDKWENLLKVQKSAQAARNALAEIADEFLTPSPRP